MVNGPQNERKKKNNNEEKSKIQEDMHIIIGLTAHTKIEMANECLIVKGCARKTATKN